MLLSIVVNLLSSVNGTQSASQAASPLLHHGGATQPHDCSWCRILRSRPSHQAKRSNSITAAVSFRLRLHDFSIYEVLYCQTDSPTFYQLAHHRPRIQARL